MTSPTLDDAMQDAAADRALLVTVEFRIDPTWTSDQLLAHLVDTVRLTYRQLLPVMEAS